MTTEGSQQEIAALEQALRNEGAQFALAERAARFGYWRLRLADNHVTWSPGMYRLRASIPMRKPTTTGCSPRSRTKTRA